MGVDFKYDIQFNLFASLSGQNVKRKYNMAAMFCFKIIIFHMVYIYALVYVGCVQCFSCMI